MAATAPCASHPTASLLQLPPHLHLDAARRRREAPLRLPEDRHEPRDDREALRRRPCRRRATRRDDRRVRVADREPTGNPPGSGDDSLPSKVKEPFVFYEVPRRAGDRGRTGDVQLGKLSWPLRGKAFSAAVAEMG